MNGNRSEHNYIRELGPEGRVFPSFIPFKRSEMTLELQKYMHTLGPTPKRSLESFVDLGLSDTEIARYFKIPSEVVEQLREVWEIDEAI